MSLIDFSISGVLLGALMLWYGIFPDWRIAALPFFVLIAFSLALGAGLWVAALNVRYRDLRQLIPFVVQIGLYVSPVGFSSTNISGSRCAATANASRTVSWRSSMASRRAKAQTREGLKPLVGGAECGGGGERAHQVGSGRRQLAGSDQAIEGRSGEDGRRSW